ARRPACGILRRAVSRGPSPAVPRNPLVARLLRLALAALECVPVAGAARADDLCAAPFTPIPAIQGAGATAAATGPVVTRGVVVAGASRAVDLCASPSAPSPEVQDAGATAAVTSPVVTRGVVVADFEGRAPALGGFLLQDSVGDGYDATADALFVSTGDADSV